MLLITLSHFANQPCKSEPWPVLGGFHSLLRHLEAFIASLACFYSHVCKSMCTVHKPPHFRHYLLDILCIHVYFEFLRIPISLWCTMCTVKDYLLFTTDNSAVNVSSTTGRVLYSYIHYGMILNKKTITDEWHIF